MENENQTKEKDAFVSSLGELSTTDIAPRLPKKHPPVAAALLRSMVVLLLLAVMIYCFAEILASVRGYREADDLYSVMAEDWGGIDALLNEHFAVSKSNKNSHGETTSEYGTPTVPEAPSSEDNVDSATIIMLKAKFAALKETNPDVIGWITIPETLVDYPIVHTEDNDYYLDHSFSGTKLAAGTIFADYRNNGDFSDQNTVIYGHNMASGAMFATLARYKISGYISRSPYVYIQTEQGIYVYKIFAVYETNRFDPYIRTSFTSKNDFVEWAKSRQSQALRKISYTFKGEEQVITLSTCTNGFGDDGRLAVHAVLYEIRK